MASKPETEPTLPGPNRRRFGLQLAAGALGLSSALGSGLAQAAPDRLFSNPWAKAMRRSLGDNTQVALLWWTAATQAQRGAATLGCGLGSLLLADLEWESLFQISIDQDARRFHLLPIIQQDYVAPWFAAAEAAWNRLDPTYQTRWTMWLNSDLAQPTFNSLRAEEITLSWGQANWPIDPRSGIVVAAPMVLAAQALRDLGMHGNVTEVIRQLDERVAQSWLKMGAGRPYSQDDRRWLQPLAGALQQLAPAITNGLFQTSNQQWPQRLDWLQGPLGTVPAQCGFVNRGVVAAPMLAADFVPTTMGRFCGLR